MLTQDAKKYGIHKSQQKPGDKKIVRIERNKVAYYEDGTKRALNDNPGMMDKPTVDTADSENAVIAKIDLDDMKFSELKKHAKKKGIRFSNKDNKEDLIKLIKEAN
jgi:hypothetical protein